MANIDTKYEVWKNKLLDLRKKLSLLRTWKMFKVMNAIQLSSVLVMQKTMQAYLE